MTTMKMTTTMISDSMKITDPPIYDDYEIEIENIKNKVASRKDVLVSRLESQVRQAITKRGKDGARKRFDKQITELDSEAKKAIRSLLEEFTARWHMHRISVDVAYITGLSVDDILSSRRTRVAQSRQVCVWFLRETTEATYPILARLWKCNHTTLIHSYKQVQNDVEKQQGPLWELVCDVLKYASCPYEGLFPARKRV